MLYSSLAILALAMPSLGNFLHLHPVRQPDGRVQVTLVNRADRFRDIKVDGHSYELGLGQQITIKATAGTIVYRDSSAPLHERGEILVAMTPEISGTVIAIH